MLLNRHFFFVAKASALTEDLGQDEERRNRCPCDKVERQLYFCPFGCQSDHQCDRVPHQLCHGDGNGDSREPTSIIRYERVTCRQGCEDLAQFKTDKDDSSDHHNILIGLPDNMEINSIPAARITIAPMRAVIHMTIVTSTVMMAAMEFPAFVLMRLYLPSGLVDLDPVNFIAKDARLTE